MIKSYCDSCEREISPQSQDVSIFKSVQWKMLGKNGMQPIPMQEDFCDKCTEAVKKTIDTLKKEAKNKVN